MKEELEKMKARIDELLKQCEQLFKNGDIVESTAGSVVLITDYENSAGYGIDIMGNWTRSNCWSFKSNPKNWKLSTKERWLEILTKEAEKRYKVKDTIKRPDFFRYNGTVILIHSNHSPCFLDGLNTFNFYGNQVMQDGIWAELIKEETLDELASRFAVHLIKSNNTVYEDFIDFFNENKEIIHKLSK